VQANKKSGSFIVLSKFNRHSYENNLRMRGRISFSSPGMNANVMITVLNAYGSPLQGAIVMISQNKSGTTDKHGNFV